MGYNLGCPPSQDASHYQDDYIFSREKFEQHLYLFATITRGGRSKV